MYCVSVHDVSSPDTTVMPVLLRVCLVNGHLHPFLVVADFRVLAQADTVPVQNNKEDLQGFCKE